MAENNPKKKKGFFHKLHDKYRLVLMNDDTFEEKLSFRLTRFNVFIFFGTVAIFLVFATTYLIAFTPLREYIPGYADFNTRKVLRELNLKADSLQAELRSKDLYIMNIRNIVEGRELVYEMPEPLEEQEFVEINELTRSREDSILRAQIESELRITGFSPEQVQSFEPQPMSQFFFFPPINGIITNHFNPAQRHFGIDIVAEEEEPIKATLDGTVLFSTWTMATGYTIGIQHANNIVSVYKHNSRLLKEEGSYVKAGEVIAIIGGTGTLSTGTHLHFELWFNGNPVNPLDYIVF
ncbi:MAG: M23 family metallopeptidase [Bacteroidetes bacterium]|nr:MAG: M23 family metallopeptidase [Bacteroidota bacterium]